MGGAVGSSMWMGESFSLYTKGSVNKNRKLLTYCTKGNGGCGSLWAELQMIPASRSRSHVHLAAGE